MPDMETCIKAVDNAKMPTPTRPGGDYEVMGVMWCGGEWERHYSATWWKDAQKEVEK